MKKLFLLAILALTCTMFGSLNAQNVFKKGDQVVNLGVGLGSYLGGSGYKQSLLPLSASYEKGILDGLFDGKGSIGVGGYLGYASNKWSSVVGDIEYGYKYNYYILGARGAVHYSFVDKLDTYGGIMLGYNIISSSYFGGNDNIVAPSASASGLAFSLHLGARYYVSNNIAVFGEVGYGIAALELGVAFGL